MSIPEFAARDRPTRVRADLAVHLTGRHDTQAVTLARSILVVMPAARIRLSHPQPALAAFNAWRDAVRLAADLFPGHDDQEAQTQRPGPAVSGQVALDQPVPGATVDALAAAASPTGTAQIRVRLGALLIIAADRDAVDCQHALWSTAYRHAADLWPDLPTHVDQPHPPGHGTPSGNVRAAGRPDILRRGLVPIPEPLSCHTP